MPDYEKLIDQLFEKKNTPNTVEYINSLITNIINEQGQGEGEKSAEEIKKYLFRILPKFEFREIELGKGPVEGLDNDTRQQFYSFFSTALKGKKTLIERIKFINDMSNQPPTKKIKSNVKDVLSTLMVLKIIEGIVKGSSASPAGLQFESLISAMITGTPDKAGEPMVAQKVGGTSAIDVKIIDGANYQIKLVAKKEVGVAYTGLKKYFDDNQVLNFLVVIKEQQDALSFYQFPLTKKVFVDLEKDHIEQRKLGLQKKISKYTDLSKKIGPQEIKEMVMEEIADKAAPAPQQQTLFSPNDITQKQPKQKAPPKSDLEKEIEGGTMKIPTTLFPKKPTAKLSINPDVFANYNEKLKEDVVAVLSNLSDLIDNINKFYIQNTPGSANAAKTNAANIQQNI